MKNNFLKGFASILALQIVACSSTLKVQSEPVEAEVFVAQQKSSDKKSLGKTPLEISFPDLYSKAGGSVAAGQFLVLYIQAKDHEVEKVLLPPTAFGVTTALVQVKLQSSNELMNAAQVLQRLHNAQKFAQNGQFERAHVETDKALEVDAKFPRAISMKGSIYFLEKNYTESLKWFEKALTIDPAFDEAVKMINRIKQETGKQDTGAGAKP